MTHFRHNCYFNGCAHCDPGLKLRPEPPLVAQAPPEPPLLIGVQSTVFTHKMTTEQLDAHVQDYRAPLLVKIAELEERIREAEKRESATRVRIRARIDAMEPAAPMDDFARAQRETRGFNIAKSEALDILDEEWEKA